MNRWIALWQLQARALVRDTGVLITFFGGLMLYALVYPLPYLHQVAGAQPVLLIDQDNSGTSRELVRALQASPGIQFVATNTSLSDAQQAVLAGQSKGLVMIPAGFETRLRRGGSATVVAAADGHYFLSYGTIAEQVARASLSLGGQVQLARRMMAGADPASSRQGGVTLNMVPASNLKMGYLDYILPGLFVLILHQIMLICVGVTVIRVQRRPGSWQRMPVAAGLSVMASLLIPPFVLASLLYLGPLLAGYEVALQGSLFSLLSLLLPFWLATFLLGVVLGSLFRHRDSYAQLLVLISMPLLFTAGFVWPVESMPTVWTLLWGIVPSQAMMQGMIQLTKLGGEDVLALQWTLWGQVLAWGLLAVLLWRRRQEKVPSDSALPEAS
ncbi:ABC transporter permease [Ferrimonas gelatinilytica]|uniref:ABC transporter permease n=1 Tax=Ferrimonas gelatinilytica TaxID=1255257 RepID=A0ABP9SE81_9GAMM